MQQLRLKAKLYVHNRNGIFKCKSKGYHLICLFSCSCGFTPLGGICIVERIVSHRGSKESLHFTIYIRASQSESGRGLFMTIYQISLNFCETCDKFKICVSCPSRGKPEPELFQMFTKMQIKNIFIVCNHK